MSETEGSAGVLVAALFDTLAPLLTVTLSVSTTLMLSMLLLRYARPATAAQLHESSSAFIRQLSFPRVASRTALLSASNSKAFLHGTEAADARVKSIPSMLNEVLTPTGVVMPRVVHRVLDAQDVNARVLVVGDVHGCLDELRVLLAKAGFDRRRDSVVLVGDLVNKGPKSAETVRFAREQGFYAVRGNHDDSALAAYFRTGRFRGEEPLPPSYAYVKALDEADVRWLSELPYSISIPHLKALVVHAGVVPGVPLAEQTAAHMSRIRSVLHKEGEGEKEGEGRHGGFEGVDFISPEKAEPWAKCYEGPLHVFFGHDAKRMLQLYPHATGLDTGACYGKALTAAVLPSGERISVRAFQVYTKPGKD